MVIGSRLSNLVQNSSYSSQRLGINIARKFSIEMSSTGIRIASLLPSATETLCAIGGSSLLVARSHEDNYPAYIVDRPIVTSQLLSSTWTSASDIDKQVSEALKEGISLYSIDENLLSELKCNVILTQDLCDVCAVDFGTVCRVASTISPRPKVISLNPQSLEEVLQDLITVGEAVGLQEEAINTYNSLRSRCTKAIQIAQQCLKSRKDPVKVGFIEWSDPIYVGGHWTPQLIHLAGGVHSLHPAKCTSIYPSCTISTGKNTNNESESASEDLNSRTPVLNETRARSQGFVVNGHRIGGAGKSYAVPTTKVVEADVDVIIVCPCGLKLEESKREAGLLLHQDWFSSLRAVREGRLFVLDGDAMFNRPGPRLVDALEWLVSVLHEQPEALALRPEGFPFERISSLPPPPPPVEDESTNTVSEPGGSGLSVEIEEAHRTACLQNHIHYIDPVTGFFVFTELAHKARGACCGSGCRHCPYGHFNVKAESRRNQVVETTLLRRKSGSNKTSRAAAQDMTDRDVFVLFWSGGKDSFLAYLSLMEEENSDADAGSAPSRRKREVVLLTTYARDTGLLAHQGLHYRDIMNQAKHLDLDLLLVPLPCPCLDSPYVDTVTRGLLVVQEAYRMAQPPTLVFGDLHLQDIRAWREQSFSSYNLLFPLFRMPYDVLLSKLFRHCKENNIVITISAVTTFYPTTHQAPGTANQAGVSSSSTRQLQVGDVYEEGTVAALPEGCDKMGENGEFHTHVMFSKA